MNSIVEIHGKPVSIRFSSTAIAALAQRTSPLLIEMVLHFSCAARKEVRFLESDSGPAGVSIMPRLDVRFSPLVNRFCSTDEKDATPLSEYEPVRNPAAFVPRWLNIDFCAGGWQGEFGYNSV
jgi:hypothetical protein